MDIGVTRIMMSVRTLKTASDLVNQTIASNVAVPDVSQWKASHGRYNRQETAVAKDEEPNCPQASCEVATDEEYAIVEE